MKPSSWWEGRQRKSARQLEGNCHCLFVSAATTAQAYPVICGDQHQLAAHGQMQPLAGFVLQHHQTGQGTAIRSDPGQPSGQIDQAGSLTRGLITPVSLSRARDLS
jgi:hypothetical protein